MQGDGIVPRWRSTAARRDLGEDVPLSLTRWLAFDAALAPFEKAGMGFEDITENEILANLII